MNYRNITWSVKEFVIDLFCGAGGTSTGVHLSNTSSIVTFCINHDHNAINSHRENHPYAKHMQEDIRNAEVIFFLKLRINALRKLFPGCKITVWASLECTNFSKAKGGLPRNADSRTLANFLLDMDVHFKFVNGRAKKIRKEYFEELRTEGALDKIAFFDRKKVQQDPDEVSIFKIKSDGYITAANPDYIMIENVMEFMSWGPLDEKGKPISKQAGEDYVKWRENIKALGYQFDWKPLNAADFGALTTRTRYFAQFALGSLPISWPEPTHTKNPDTKMDLFSGLEKRLKKWRAVREVLDFSDEGKSIFNRKKDLVDKTLERIYAGLLKFIANGDEAFIMKYFSGSPEGKVISIDGPAGTVRTADGQAYVNCNSINFLQSYYGNGGAHSENEPCPTVSTVDRFGLVKIVFIDQQYGKSKPRGVIGPIGAITNNPKFALVNSYLMPTSFNNKPRSIDEPAPIVLAGKKHHYIINPQYSSSGNSVDNPCPVIIARQDKRPLGLVSCTIYPDQPFFIPIYDSDSEIMIKIKKLMAYYGITDIKMRMLKVVELKQIQGFPKNYVLKGTQTEQKKFIGNSVEVTVAKALFSAHNKGIQHYYKQNLIRA